MKQKPLNLIDIAREYSDDEKARKLIESMRWANGRVCPHRDCGSSRTTELVAREGSKHPVPAGTYKCKDCRKKFTVRVGTIFEDSHIGLGKWLMVIFLMCSSKKSMSANQIHRMIGVTYKSAWYMCHRIRHGMTVNAKAPLLKGIVEADETYFGGKPRKGDVSTYRATGRPKLKAPVVALVERDGQARARVVADITAASLRDMLLTYVDKDTHLCTDELKAYKPAAGRVFKSHNTTKHSDGEYSRKIESGLKVHSNTVESLFALMKRSVYGTYHAVSKKHLHRYVDEWVFRWNLRQTPDGDMVGEAVRAFERKRLTYRRARQPKQVR